MGCCVPLQRYEFCEIFFKNVFIRIDHILTTPLPAYNGYSSPGIVRLMKILLERKSYLWIQQTVKQERTEVAMRRIQRSL